MEVWSNDVVNYPQAFAAAQASGIFPLTDVAAASPADPGSFTLRQNYPNPFNPATTISYEISTTSQVSVVVFDLLGRRVQTLVDEVQRAGSYGVRFDATGLASGVYFYELKAGSFVQTRNMVLIK
jgi:hypothetical protein